MYVFPALLDDELHQHVRRFGNTPSDALVIADFQVPCLSCIPEGLVVVCPVPAAILDSILQMVEVYHLVQDGGNHVFDWPVQRPRADVQLVAAFPVRTGPRFSNGNMPVGPGRGLDGNNWLL